MLTIYVCEDITLDYVACWHGGTHFDICPYLADPDTGPWTIHEPIDASGLSCRNLPPSRKHVNTRYKGRNQPESQKQANRSHAKLRGPGERAKAQLKSWRILRKLRCSPDKASHLVKAIAVLQNHRAAQATTQGRKGFTDTPGCRPSAKPSRPLSPRDLPPTTSRLALHLSHRGTQANYLREMPRIAIKLLTFCAHCV